MKAIPCLKSRDSVRRGVAGVLVAVFFAADACEAFAEDASSEVRAAFARLVAAPNHTFLMRAEPESFQRVTEVTGKAERDGWAHFTQTSTNGTFEFVFKRRKGLVRSPNGWNSVADLIRLARAQEKTSDRPMIKRRELVTLTSRQLPLDAVTDIVGRISTFRKEGDTYTCDLTPEEAGTALGVEKSKGAIIPARLHCRVRVELGFPVLMEVRQQIGEGAQKKESSLTFQFSEIGKSKLEIPAEARQRLEAPLSQAATAPRVAAAPLTRPEALELAARVEEQFSLIHQMLFYYAIGNEGDLRKGKTSNEQFRVLFQTGICEDEMIFAIPDARARASRTLPDGQLGSVDDDFAKAVAPGECDVTLALPGPNITGPPGRPALRVDIKAADGTIVVVVGMANGSTRVLETRDGIIPSEDATGGDGFSQVAGVKEPILLKPE